MKKCCTCKELKDVHQFDNDSTNKDGKSRRCKLCQKETIRKINYAKYGTTIEEYNNLFDVQKGCCAICGRHQTEFPKRLAVDHLHGTKKVRGLLCKNCNLLLGYAQDSSEILEKARNYLLKD